MGRALPCIDPVTQCLRDEGLVPRCEFCGGEVTLCVRGGEYFNEVPFHGMERAWEGFVKGVEEEIERDEGESVKVVVLELGVGLNTPGVLRWPNEDLVSESEGFRLVRVGMDVSGYVPWELEEQDLAVGISGDIKLALDSLLS